MKEQLTYLIFQKGAEYYRSAYNGSRHGCARILSELEPICLEAKKHGVTFAYIVEAMAKYGSKIPPDDPFIQHVKSLIPSGKPTLTIAR